MIITPWSIADKALLVKMWQEGCSAHMIAAKLGNGRTRNSVLGFIHRLRRKDDSIALRNENTRSNPNPDSVRISKPKKKSTPKVKIVPLAQLNFFTVIEEEPAPVGGIPFFETRMFQCKYILNTSKDPHNIKCCGGKTYRSTSWCRTHYAEVFTERTYPGKQVGHLSSGKTPVASKFQFRRM